MNAGTSTVALTAGGVNQLLTVTGTVTGTGGVTYTADNMTLPAPPTPAPTSPPCNPTPPASS